jgi:hypothetical protein
MSLTNILKGIGRRILGGKKESATPATGQQTKQITYTPKPSQEQAKKKLNPFRWVMIQHLHLVQALMIG